MNTSPLAALLSLSLIVAFGALLAGLFILAALLGCACGGICWRLRQPRTTGSQPSITYLSAPRADKPLIRLKRGQSATVPWPHQLQILLAEGSRLQILEATPERVRVMAV
ncbi:MAG: hypothetical protein B7Z37_25215 [Verrucomicrobia bacterium 12-59-8]|nr:MAG: hypothetical protein B7Z37_25215 [Verrucomicrobia bacterium 12-59-8]